MCGRPPAAPLSPLSETDIQKMLAASVHIGSRNLDFQMEPYIYKRRGDGACLTCGGGPRRASHAPWRGNSHSLGLL